MHKVVIPDNIVQRVINRCGTAHPFARLMPARTALVVIDMQNGFMRQDVAHAWCPMAAEIVPQVNRLAASLRAAGGGVFWIQNATDEATRREWSVLEEQATPARRAARQRSMTPGSEGHALWPGLDVRPEDRVVAKYRYSAFIQGASELPAMLRAQGFDTVLICGTVTNVCCESSARDAMMLNFRTIMVTDGNAALSDEEHNAALINFYNIFGDIMSVAEIEEFLAAAPVQGAA